MKPLILELTGFSPVALDTFYSVCFNKSTVCNYTSSHFAQYHQHYHAKNINSQFDLDNLIASTYSELAASNQVARLYALQSLLGILIQKNPDIKGTSIGSLLSILLATSNLVGMGDINLKSFRLASRAIYKSPIPEIDSELFIEYNREIDKVKSELATSHPFRVLYSDSDLFNPQSLSLPTIQTKTSAFDPSALVTDHHARKFLFDALSNPSLDPSCDPSNVWNLDIKLELPNLLAEKFTPIDHDDNKQKLCAGSNRSAASSDSGYDSDQEQFWTAGKINVCEVKRPLSTWEMVQVHPEYPPFQNRSSYIASPPRPPFLQFRGESDFDKLYKSLFSHSLDDGIYHYHINEERFVEHVLLMAIGIPSDTFSWCVSSSKFILSLETIGRLRIKSMTLASFGSIADKFIELGTNFRRLQLVSEKITLNVNRFGNTGLSFARGIRCYSDYVKELILQVGDDFQKPGNTKGVLSLISELEVISWMVGFVASLCYCNASDQMFRIETSYSVQFDEDLGFGIPEKSCLIDYLWQVAKQLDDTAVSKLDYLLRNIVVSILHSTAFTFFNLLQAWIGPNGEKRLEMHDSYNEFFTSRAKDIPNDSELDFKMSEDTVVPGFLGDIDARDILVAGCEIRLLNNNRPDHPLFRIETPEIDFRELILGDQPVDLYLEKLQTYAKSLSAQVKVGNEEEIAASLPPEREDIESGFSKVVSEKEEIEKILAKKKAEWGSQVESFLASKKQRELENEILNEKLEKERAYLERKRQYFLSTVEEAEKTRLIKDHTKRMRETTKKIQLVEWRRRRLEFADKRMAFISEKEDWSSEEHVAASQETDSDSDAEIFYDARSTSSFGEDNPASPFSEDQPLYTPVDAEGATSFDITDQDKKPGVVIAEESSIINSNNMYPLRNKEEILSSSSEVLEEEGSKLVESTCPLEVEDASSVDAREPVEQSMLTFSRPASECTLQNLPAFGIENGWIHGDAGNRAKSAITGVEDMKAKLAILTERTDPKAPQNLLRSSLVNVISPSICKVVKGLTQVIHETVLQHVLRGEGLLKHFEFARDFYLLGNGTICKLLKDHLFSDGLCQRGKPFLSLNYRKSWPPGRTEFGSLLLFLRQSIPNTEHLKFGYDLQEKIPGEPNACDALNFMRMEYIPTGSAALILTASARSKYGNILKFLLLLIRCEEAIGSVCRSKWWKTSGKCTGWSVATRKSALALYDRLKGFFSTFFMYVIHIGIGEPYNLFLKDLEAAINSSKSESTITNLDTLTSSHDETLDRMHWRLFLRPNQRRLAVVVKDMLQIVLTFSRLTCDDKYFVNETTIEQEESQVQSLAEKFTKSRQILVKVLENKRVLEDQPVDDAGDEVKPKSWGKSVKERLCFNFLLEELKSVNDEL